MNLPFYIARKYFVSSNHKGFVYLVSSLFLTAIIFAGAALIFVLSIFNGLTDHLKAVHKTFDSELKISPAKGKVFDVRASLIDSIQNVEGVAVVSQIIEDDAIISYQNARSGKERRKVVKVKGVSSNYHEQNRLDTAIVFGSNVLSRGNKDYCIMGYEVAINTEAQIGDTIHRAQFIYPKRKKKSLRYSNKSFNMVSALPGGVFQLESEYDSRYVIVPLHLAEILTDYNDQRTSLELKTTDDFTPNEVKTKLQSLLGPDFIVQNSDEQHAGVYKAIKIEKLFVYVFANFVLIVLGFNLFSILSLIIFGKQKDISLLKVAGFKTKSIKLVFVWLSAIIGFVGSGVGLLLGFGLVFLQGTIGFIKMNGESTLLQTMPVRMSTGDFLYTGFSTVIVCIIISIFPIRKISHIEPKDNL